MHIAQPLRLPDQKWRGRLTLVRSVCLPVYEPGNRRLRPVRPVLPLRLTVAQRQHFYRTFSVNLYFMHSPEDLMTKFVECIVRLPNLKTLEILNVGSRAPISKALRRKHAIFPSVRELRITPACHHFIKKCPNLESVTFVREMDTHAPSTLRTHGKGLRRIAGVTLYCGHGVPGQFFNRSPHLNNYSAEAYRSD